MHTGRGLPAWWKREEDVRQQQAGESPVIMISGLSEDVKRSICHCLLIMLRNIGNDGADGENGSGSGGGVDG